MGWDAEAAASLLVTPSMRSALLLGLGGATVARQLRVLHPTATLVGVEIDPEVVELAVSHCNLGSMGVRVALGDGEAYVRHPGRVYDFVLDDMWDHSQRCRRAAIALRDWPRVLGDRLTDRGVCAINLYEHSLDSRTFSTVRKRLAKVFDVVVEARVPGSRVAVLAGTRTGNVEATVDQALRKLKPSSRRWMSAVAFRTC
jgi:spermidine synthase